MAAVKSHFDFDDDGGIQFAEWRVWLVFVLRSTFETIGSCDALYAAVMRMTILPVLLKRRSGGEGGRVEERRRCREGEGARGGAGSLLLA